MLGRPAQGVGEGSRVDDRVWAPAVHVEVLPACRRQPHPQGAPPRLGQMNFRAQRARGQLDPERGEEIKVVFRLVLGPRVAAVRDTVGKRAVEPETMPVADPARDRRLPRGRLAKRVRVQMDNGRWAPTAHRGDESLARGRCGRVRQADKPGQQRVTVQERAHDLARREDKPLLGPLRAQRGEARRSDDHVAHPVGTAQEKRVHGDARQSRTSLAYSSQVFKGRVTASMARRWRRA